MTNKKIKPIAEALRLLRVYSDISQTEMAENLGFNSPILSAMEKGWREITVKTLEKYAQFFKIKIDDILYFANAIETNKEIKKEIFDAVLKRIKEGI